MAVHSVAICFASNHLCSAHDTKVLESGFASIDPNQSRRRRNHFYSSQIQKFISVHRWHCCQRTVVGTIWLLLPGCLSIDQLLFAPYSTIIFIDIRKDPNSCLQSIDRQNHDQPCFRNLPPGCQTAIDSCQSHFFFFLQCPNHLSIWVRVCVIQTRSDSSYSRGFPAISSALFSSWRNPCSSKGPLFQTTNVYIHSVLAKEGERSECLKRNNSSRPSFARHSFSCTVGNMNEPHSGCLWMACNGISVVTEELLPPKRYVVKVG